MTAKLILCGKGKVLFVPDTIISQSDTKAFADALRHWEHNPDTIVAVFGMPVEIIDNREAPEPGTVATA